MLSDRFCWFCLFAAQKIYGLQIPELTPSLLIAFTSDMI